MKFSILTPVYNVEKYIVECIESVLNQTYTNFEFILVDSGSRDNSGVICDEYAEKDSRIRVIHKDNEGIISARRVAIKIATGDVCVFLDSDDYLELNTLEVLEKEFKSTKCDCICYGWKRVSEKREFLSNSEDIPVNQILTDKAELYKRVFTNSSLNSLCRKAVKREILTDYDYSEFYKCNIGEDLLQSIEILKNAKAVSFINENLYNVRTNMNSVTRSINYHNHIVDYTVRNAVLKFLKAENVWSDEDYAVYKTYCIKLFAAELFRIASFDTSRANKKSIFEKIKDEEYYKEFLSSAEYDKKAIGWKRILIEKIKKDRFCGILNIVAFYRFLAKCYRCFRNR